MIGQTLGGYRITEQIGMGGMATVYKAYHPAMDRYVALKVLPAHFAQEASFVQRFRQEAKLIARMEHDHILPVYDFGEQDGIAYLALRYLDAGTLKDRIHTGPLSLKATSLYLSQLASALDYAHARGVVHRDVKPSNVLFDPQDRVLLSDFGISKMISGDADLTGSGLVGTPSYMAPEVGLGKPADHLSDQYSLGVVLYEMITGQAPYEAETPMAVLHMHIHSPLPLPTDIRPDLPAGVSEVIYKVMAKEPADRFENCTQVAEALDTALEGKPIRLLQARPKAAKDASATVTRPARVAYGGLGLGLVVSVLMLFPMYGSLPAQYVADWVPASMILGWLCVLLSAALVVVGTTRVIRWSGIGGQLRTGLSGVFTGTIAGVVVFMLLGAAGAGVMGTGDVLAYGPHPAQNERHFTQLLVDTVTQIMPYTYAAFWLAVLIGGLLGALGGLLARSTDAEQSAPLNENRIRLLVIPPLVAPIITALSYIVSVPVYFLLPESAAKTAREVGVTPALPVEGMVNWPTSTVLALFFASTIWLLVTIWRSGLRSEDSTCLRRLGGATRLGAVFFVVIGFLLWITYGPSPFALHQTTLTGWLSVGAGVLLIAMSVNLKRQARAQEKLETAYETVAVEAPAERTRIRFVDIVIYILYFVFGLVLLVMLMFLLDNPARVLLCGLPILIALPIAYEVWFVRRSRRQTTVDLHDRKLEKTGFWFRNLLPLSLSTGIVIWLPIFLLAAPALSMVLGVLVAIPMLSSFDPANVVSPDQVFTTAGIVNSIFRLQATFAALGFLISSVVGAFLSLIIHGLIQLLTIRPKAW